MAFSVRIALGIEYDGAAFCGWQTQPSGCGVQDHLEAALKHIAGDRVESVCAGRTDAGVHAMGQVVHFDTGAERPDSAWVRGVNTLLPAACAVNWSHPVPGDFHARYSASARSYSYMLLNHPVRPAVDRARVGWFHLPLDLETMQLAARLLIGEHDFSAFRSSECQARTPVRTLTRLDVARAGPHRVELAPTRPAPNGAQHRRLPGLRRERQIPSECWRGAGGPRPQCAAPHSAAGLLLSRVSTKVGGGCRTAARELMTCPLIAWQPPSKSAASPARRRTRGGAGGRNAIGPCLCGARARPPGAPPRSCACCRRSSHGRLFVDAKRKWCARRCRGAGGLLQFHGERP